MGGGALGGNNPYKIKGGKWTVVRFFLVAIAHSVGWFTVGFGHATGTTARAVFTPSCAM